jgi:membrane protease YdiL (CAAX protease family)
VIRKCPFIRLTIGIEEEYLVVILTIVFTILVIFIVGLIPFGALFKRKGIEKSHGAFVLISPGTYFLAAIVAKIKFKNKDGNMRTLYVLFSPYSLFPWSGLPVILAKEKNVIALNISYRELYSITVSLGRNTPEVLDEEIPKITEESTDENIE